MSLYGALFSGVSGLSAQSSAMGAISDNISNVSTIGYKNTRINFQTLVTKQTSSTQYSAGGVQSKSRAQTDVQGLLQASTSSTDIAISGDGFFVVNRTNTPTSSDQYLYSRAGSFIKDNEGYLQNAQGFYLQGWPTDAAGNVIPADSALTIPNQNIISNQYLETVNLSRVGGSASATTKIEIGANLPSNASPTDAHNTDAQFFDTLGNAYTMRYVYTRSSVANQWDISAQPPIGTATLAMLDEDNAVYDSYGQLEFTGRPTDGSVVTIDGTTYEFDDDATYSNPTAQVDKITFSQGGSATYDALDAYEIDINGTTFEAVLAGGETPTDVTNLFVTAITNNAALSAIVTATNVAGVLTLTANTAGDPFTTAMTITNDAGTVDEAFTLDTAGAGASVPNATGNVQVDISTSTSLTGDVTALIAAVKDYDTDFANYGGHTNTRISVASSSAATVLFHEDGTNQFTVDGSGLIDANGDPAVKQTTAFTVQKQNESYTDFSQIKFTTIPADGDTIKIGDYTYTFQSGETAGDGDLTIATVDTVDNPNMTAGTMSDDAQIAEMLADLKAAIEANDPNFPASGKGARVRNDGNGDFNNVLTLDSLGTDFTVTTTGFAVEAPIGTAVAAGAPGFTVGTDYGLEFDSDGLPKALNVAKVEIAGFTNGAADMDGDTINNADFLTLDLGTVGEADGMTQFGDNFTPSFISQNGSRFGYFAGVSIGTDGLVTALFDNGEVRPIYKVPLATFTNPNGLESVNGNSWIATEFSGDYTLREADNGPSGQIAQASLESSTVDIGEEFTSMIVVQRAYSAATKIISTADQMLEELMRTKR